MKRIFTLIMASALIVSAFGQFRKGYDITYNSASANPSVDMGFDESFMGTNVFTNENTACAGGVKTMTKTAAGSRLQGVMNMDNGTPLDIDFKTYPYATVRIRVSCASDINFEFQVQGIGADVKTIKGNNVWNIVRFDYNKNKIGNYYSNFIQMAFSNESTFPYTIEIDYIKLGDQGDPDPAVAVGMANVVSPVIAEKNAGQQSIDLSGITNGVNTDNITLSLVNSKPTIFESTTFDPIQPDGTAKLNYIPKTGSVGVATLQVIAKYNRGDSVIKYKSIWFDLMIVTDPSMKINNSTNTMTGQMNAAKILGKITNATNSTGGASKLRVDVSCTNTTLITNLKADPIKSDGTSQITFIPGLDQCGEDTITAVLYDSNTTRTTTYKVFATVTNPAGPCVSKLNDAQNNELKVYPNPASNKITVTVASEKGFILSIVDVTGRSLDQIRIPAGQTEALADVSKLDEGIYFITDNTGKNVQKFTVKR